MEVRILQGFAYACAEERWRREAAEIGCYERGARGGAPSLLFKGGRRAWGGGVLVGLPSSLGRRVGGRSPPPPRIRVSPHKVSFDPFLVFKQTPRTLLEPSRTFRNLLESPYKHSRTFPNLENDPQYMNLILRTIPDLLVMSRIQSETPNNIRSPTQIPYLLQTTSNLKCVTLWFVNMQT